MGRGRGGVPLKVNIFQGKYEVLKVLTFEAPPTLRDVGGEFKPKDLSSGGVWIFSETT